MGSGCGLWGVVGCCEVTGVQAIGETLNVGFMYLFKEAKNRWLPYAAGKYASDALWRPTLLPVCVDCQHQLSRLPCMHTV